MKKHILFTIIALTTTPKLFAPQWHQEPHRCVGVFYKQSNDMTTCMGCRKTFSTRFGHSCIPSRNNTPARIQAPAPAAPQLTAAQIADQEKAKAERRAAAKAAAEIRRKARQEKLAAQQDAAQKQAAARAALRTQRGKK